MHNAASFDPVPAVVEADAVGDMAELFADIRATLGVPVVNLIWRHLATIPGALPWAWALLKPLYGTGVIAAEARGLSTSVSLPSGGAALNARALSAAGLSSADVDQIDMILHSYARSNAMNIIAIGALSAHLTGATQPDTGLLVKPSLPAEERPISGNMPRLLSPDETAADTRVLIERLNAFGGHRAILPTMYRHLAHWPGYLGLVHDILAPVDADRRLETLIDSILSESRIRSAPLGAALLNSSNVLDSSVRGDVETALTTFADGPLCKMIAIVAIISAAMPSDRS